MLSGLIFCRKRQVVAYKFLMLYNIAIFTTFWKNMCFIFLDTSPEENEGKCNEEQTPSFPQRVDDIAESFSPSSETVELRTGSSPSTWYFLPLYWLYLHLLWSLQLSLWICTSFPVCFALFIFEPFC